jgi:hypothetical protein
MILLFEWCRKNKIQFEYLYDKSRIHKTARNKVNTIGVKKEDAGNLKETHKEFFKPLVLAKHRGNLDFSITLKDRFHLHPPRPTMLTIQQQKSLRMTRETLLKDGMEVQIATEFASPVVIVKKKRWNG